MRGVLVDWLVEVHQQFHLLVETLYLTVAIIDRYLQVGLQFDVRIMFKVLKGFANVSAHSLFGVWDFFLLYVCNL